MKMKSKNPNPNPNPNPNAHSQIKDKDCSNMETKSWKRKEQNFIKIYKICTSSFKDSHMNKQLI